jgi:hypothetical protein
VSAAAPGREPPDTLLLPAAASMLLIVRIALVALPLAATRRLARRIAEWMPGRRFEDAARVGATVRFASRRMPRIGSCLTEAIAAAALLQRGGHDPRLRIGVARNSSGGIEAHAWLECAGIRVVGELADLDRYLPLGRRHVPPPILGVDFGSSSEGASPCPTVSILTHPPRANRASPTPRPKSSRTAP